MDNDFRSDDISDEEGLCKEENPHETPEKEILWAASNGEYELAMKLLEAHPNLVSVQDSDGYTPLHRACYENHVDIVELLLNSGADICAKTKQLWQPLHSACKWNNTPVVALLLDYGADINAQTKGGLTPLHLAASNANAMDILILLLNHPCIDPHIKSNSGETPYEISRRSTHISDIFSIVDPSINKI